MDVTCIEDPEHYYFDRAKNRVIHQIEDEDAEADELLEAALELDENDPARATFFELSWKHRENAANLDAIVAATDNAEDALLCNDDPEMEDELEQSHLEAKNALLREDAHI